MTAPRLSLIVSLAIMLGGAALIVASIYMIVTGFRLAISGIILGAIIAGIGAYGLREQRKLENKAPTKA